MIIDILKEAILGNIGTLTQAPKGWHKRNCMLCHTQGHGKDTRKRFGIQFNPQSIAMNCFNCGFSAGYTEGKELSSAFKHFLRQIHIDEKFIKQIEFEIFKSRNQLAIVRDGEIAGTDKLKTLFQKWKPIDIPEDFLTIKQWLDLGVDDPDFLNVADYALSRKLYDLDKFYWSPSKQNNLNHRLIIPYYYKGKMVGFTSRLCYDTDGKEIPKYYQQTPTDFVYNLDNQQEWSRKYVIVTEGVLDAWVTDGISVLGEIGQSKIDIINRLQKEIIVIPDGDLKGSDLVDVAIENNWSVSFPAWLTRMGGFKDAAAASVKYGKLLTTYSIVSSAVSGKDKISVQWKIRQNERSRQRK